MTAPHHAIHAKLAEWSEQTTMRQFILGVGQPDGDDIALMLDMLRDKWEGIIDTLPQHAQDEAHEALDKIEAAWVAVDKALAEAALEAPLTQAETVHIHTARD